MTDGKRQETAYEVLAPLASGTYGENLVAVRREPFGVGKLFVLRQLRRSLSSDQRLRTAFVDIGRRAVRLSHPNTVQTFELGERGGALFAVTEYLEGESLDAIMAAIAPAPHAVDHRLWLLIVSEALSGLQHAHEMHDFDGSSVPFVHGGVTPRKIFITYSGRVVVTDFGLAALARHARRIEGTFLPEMVSYAAPEQRAGHACDARADVYAVGLVLWELLTGRRHRNPTDLDSEVEPLPPVRELKDSLDPQLSAIVSRALAANPADRFQSALEFRRAIEAHFDLGLLRRGALKESMTALFARTRDKIPSLLSRRVERLEPMDARAVALQTSTVSVPPESTGEGEEEEAFLLASPIEALGDDAVLSVRELVSASELISEELPEASSPPDSAMPVSSVELVVDQGSGATLDPRGASSSDGDVSESAAPTVQAAESTVAPIESAVAPKARSERPATAIVETPESPLVTGEPEESRDRASHPAVTQRSPGSEPPMKAAVPDGGSIPAPVPSVPSVPQVSDEPETDIDSTDRPAVGDKNDTPPSSKDS